MPEGIILAEKDGHLMGTRTEIMCEGSWNRVGRVKMIIDINAFTGNWPFYPVKGDIESVCNSLRKYSVEKIFLSSLDAVWCRNPHIFNDKLYKSVEGFDYIWPVPVLDPTIATWRRELDYAKKHPKVKLIRLLPAYSPYKLSDADELLNSLAKANLGAIIQTRMEDTRRQHPLAQIQDVPIREIVDVAERHSKLKVIIGGARKGDILSIKNRLLDLPNLYADTSQAEGINGLKEIVESGLTCKLVFGSHAPLLIPHSALVRVIADLDDETSSAILWENANKIVT
jgi:hypothetical protein